MGRADALPLGAHSPGLVPADVHVVHPAAVIPVSIRPHQLLDALHDRGVAVSVETVGLVFIPSHDVYFSRDSLFPTAQLYSALCLVVCGLFDSTRYIAEVIVLTNYIHGVYTPSYVFSIIWLQSHVHTLLGP